MEIDFRYTLDARKDALFIAYGPRESIWLQRFQPGDEIVCCHECRKVFYSEDWRDKCPLCDSVEPLYFLRANQLLLRERSRRDDSVLEYPLRALRARARAREQGEAEAELLGRIEALEGEKAQVLERLGEALMEEDESLKKTSLAACVVFTGLSVAYAVFKAVMAAL